MALYAWSVWTAPLQVKYTPPNVYAYLHRLTVLCRSHLLTHHDWSIMYNACCYWSDYLFDHYLQQVWKQSQTWIFLGNIEILARMCLGKRAHMITWSAPLIDTMKPREELWSKAADTRKSHDNENMKDVVRLGLHTLFRTYFLPATKYLCNIGCSQSDFLGFLIRHYRVSSASGITLGPWWTKSLIQASTVDFNSNEQQYQNQNQN